MKHTPGEWGVVTREHGGKQLSAYSTHNAPVRSWESDVLALGTGLVAQSNGETIEEAEANARLIASAPNLLQALKDFLQHYIQMVESGDGGFWDAEQEQIVINARAAILKAEGAQ